MCHEGGGSRGINCHKVQSVPGLDATVCRPRDFRDSILVCILEEKLGIRSVLKVKEQQIESNPRCENRGFTFVHR